MNVKQIEKPTVERATGAAALAMTLAPGVPFKIVGVRLHLSAAGGASENFTMTLDSGQAAAYDTVLLSQDMNTATDVVDNTEHFFEADDEVDFAYANTNTRTYGLEVFWREVD